jgi:ethanolaminephosphotransferase
MILKDQTAMLIKPMAYFTAEARAGLLRHRYSCEDNSLLSRFVLGPFWTRVVKVVPDWVAPNVLTLSGGACILALFAVFSYYLQGLEWRSFDDAPAWIFPFGAACVFLYQTLDALDGKHARKTNSGSALGEFLDHAIDVVVCGILSITVASVMRLGSTWGAFVLVSMTMVTFFVTTWAEYCSSVLSFYPVLDGSVEGPLLAIFVLLMPWVTADPSFFLRKPPLAFGWPFNWLCVWTFMVPVEFSLNALSIRSGLKSLPGRQKHTVPGAIIRLSGIMVLVAAFAGIAWLQPEMFHEYPRMFLLTLSLSCSHLTWQLMLAHICEINHCPVTSVFVPTALALINAIAKVVSPRFILFAHFGFVVTTMVVMFVDVVIEMSHILGVPVFTMPSKTRKTPTKLAED